MSTNLTNQNSVFVISIIFQNELLKYVIMVNQSISNQIQLFPSPSIGYLGNCCLVFYDY